MDVKIFYRDKFRILMRLIKESNAYDCGYNELCKLNDEDITTIYEILTIPNRLYNNKINELWNIICLICLYDKLCDTLISCVSNYTSLKTNNLNAFIDEYNRQHMQSFSYQDGFKKIIMREYKLSTFALSFVICRLLDFSIEWDKTKLGSHFWQIITNHYSDKLVTSDII